MTEQEHLTTEQLSAFLDKQLTPQEQAFFDAHLQSCQRCQGMLGELRRTVALLHAMPQPTLPRSFTLPAGIAQIQVPRQQPQPVQQRRVLRYALQRSVRAVSTLAAAAAVIVILSGLLAGLQFHGGASESAGTVPAASSNGTSNNTTHSAVGPRVTQGPQMTSTRPKAAASPIKNQNRTPTPRPSPAVPTLTPAATSTNDGTIGGSTPPPTLPPYLDFSQPVGRLTLGALLLLLSIVGIIATRRRRNTVS